MSSHDQPRNPTTEQTPLLRDESLQHAVADAAGSQESQVPAVQESSTRELILVLGSIWVGVFLAALGNGLVEPYYTLMIYSGVRTTS